MPDTIADIAQRSDLTSPEETDAKFYTANGKRELGDWRGELSVLSDNAD